MANYGRTSGGTGAAGNTAYNSSGPGGTLTNPQGSAGVASRSYDDGGSGAGGGGAGGGPANSGGNGSTGGGGMGGAGSAAAEPNTSKGGAGGAGGANGYSGATLPTGSRQGNNGGNGGSSGNYVDYAGGGGGGGAGGYGAVASTNGTSAASFQGGRGGTGGAGGYGDFPGYAGQGGGGGGGLSFSGTSLTIDAGGAITGGSGGTGGYGGHGKKGGFFRNTYGGSGGNGGDGIDFTGSNPVTLSNSGQITGGAGGAGGGNADGTGDLGPQGANGSGVAGANLTITNTGSISGGNNGAGDAISFLGGANHLNLGSGTLSGNLAVDGTATTLTIVTEGGFQALANAITGSGSVTLMSDPTLNSPSALFLSGVNTYSGSTTIQGSASSVEQVAVTGSILNSKILSIGSNGDLFVDNSSGIATTAAVTTANASSVLGLNASAQIGALNGTAGQVQFGNGTVLTTGTNNTDDVFGGAVGISGAANGALTKVGTGTFTLSATNFYTGATTISSGTLALSGSGAIAASSGVTDNGTFDISTTAAGASITTLSGSGAVKLGGQTLTLTGAAGAFSGAIAGTGGLVLSGGTETLSGANTYSGGTTITGGTLDLASAATFNGTMLVSAAAGTGAIDFAGTSASPATLSIEAAAQPADGGVFSNVLTNFGNYDTLDLKGLAFSNTLGDGVFYDAITTRLTVVEGGKSENYDLANGAAAYFARSDGNGGTLITDSVVCYCSGTRIRVARGGVVVDVVVEELLVGDHAVTTPGLHRPISWLGHRTIDCRNHPRPHEVLPVRISAHAFGESPARDLFLSPGHPVLVGADEDGSGGHLVPIMCLINGTTIERVAVDEVTYWHVELDEHDILLAEGLPAESYIDLGSRPWFAGAEGALYDPDMATPGMLGRCRPVAVDGPVVEAERRRLNMVFATQLTTACAWPDEASLTFG